MTTPGERQVAVPEGLDGERLDAALAGFRAVQIPGRELIGDGLCCRRADRV